MNVLFGVQFNLPWVLLLLPLAVLPWISKNNQKVIVWSEFIPDDPLSGFIRLMIRVIASIAIVALLMGLAEPYMPEQKQQKISKGAEFIILLDRSRSMDEPFAVKDRAQLVNHDLAISKRTIAAKHLIDFVNTRPNDRFGFMFFSKHSVSLLPLTDNNEAIVAVIKANALGKGISETNLGQALIKSGKMYSEYPYRGSRVLLLVSDGGESLTEQERVQIKSIIHKQKVTLYWIYLRSVDGMTLDEQNGENSYWKERPERKLHKFFKSLDIPYQVFEVGSTSQISSAFKDVNSAQLLPMMVTKVLPKKSYTNVFYKVAFVSMLFLTVIQLFTLIGVNKAYRN